MFTIGEFAALGRVSVRMLRHYDAVGVLPPASVDPATGYRHYAAEQLRRLNRIVILNDLGLTLAQVRRVLDDEVDADQLRGMLRLREAQLEEQLVQDAARLAVLRAHLRAVEREGRMSTHEVVVKSVPVQRVAHVHAVAASYEPGDITPVITPLYPRLFDGIAAAGLAMTGAPLAWYEPVEDGEAVVVHAAVPVDAPLAQDDGVAFEVVDLPPLERVATIVHHGPMDEVEPTMGALAAWIEQQGYRPLGLAREVYVDYDPRHPESGVTELQVPVGNRNT
ncbi:MerR family transcriptional regulator [Cellulomonas sp.]|uniref:MerR family transcriptional regulator n=1 Tax=Cellulomonas sp. TaxID=40001 RepID=UPI002589E5C0|nr:MerR family transcriptional regulator [Cellulomonas sp.]MCR6688804.1 MerR family transcriptional regulator [Cellulomonas sp.]